MRESAKALKTLKTLLRTSFQAYDYCFQLKPFPHNNIYQIVLYAMFDKKINEFSTSLCEKVPKTLLEL